MECSVEFPGYKHGFFLFVKFISEIPKMILNPSQLIFLIFFLLQLQDDALSDVV